MSFCKYTYGMYPVSQPQSWSIDDRVVTTYRDVGCIMHTDLVGLLGFCIRDDGIRWMDESLGR